MRWTLKKTPEKEKIKQLASELSIEKSLAEILLQRGISTFDEAKKYFRPSLEDLHDPFLMKDMDVAVNRIETAIANNENILIYGDYDVDGTTAVSLVSSYLKTYYTNVATYIPDRYAEGYGVSYLGIDFAEDNGFSLIIALDCGIKAIDKVAYAAEKNILVEMTSNGSLFNKRAIDKMLNSTITTLSISMDGATAPVFESIRKQSRFSKVVEGVSELIKARNLQNSELSVVAWSVIQKENFHELLDIVELCQGMGFDSLTLQIQMTGWGKDEWVEKNKKLAIDPETQETKKALDQAILLGEKLGLAVRVYDEGMLSFDNQCTWPWHSAYIDADGSVVPCCYVADGNVKNFGSLKNSSLSDVWVNRPYQEFRKAIAANKIPSFCENCYKECYKKVGHLPKSETFQDSESRV